MDNNDYWENDELNDSTIINKPDIINIDRLQDYDERLQEFTKKLDKRKEMIENQIIKINSLEEEIIKTSKKMDSYFKKKMREKAKIDISVIPEQNQKNNVNRNKTMSGANIMNNFRRLSKINLDNLEEKSKLTSISEKMNEIDTKDIEYLLMNYNNYISDTKKLLNDIVRGFEYDKFLIEKLRNIDKVNDVNLHDRLTFEAIFEHFEMSDSHVDKEEYEIQKYLGYLKKLLDDLDILKNKSSSLENINNQKLTKFYFEEFQKKFCQSISYFCLRFIKKLEKFDRKYEEIDLINIIKKRMNKNFREIKIKIENNLDYFNQKFFEFMNILFKKTLRNPNNYIIVKDHNVEFTEEFLLDNIKLFNNFYYDIQKQTIKLIEPEYIKFIGQLSPYYFLIKFEYIEKYKHLSLLKPQIVKSYHQKIFINTLLFLKIKLLLLSGVLSQKKINYFHEIIHNFFKYEKIYNVFGFENFNFFKNLYKEYFSELKKKKIENKKKENVDKKNLLKMEALSDLIINNLENDIIKIDKLNEIKLIISNILFSKKKISNSKIKQFLDSYYLYIITIINLSEFLKKENIKKILKKYLKISYSNIIKYNNKYHGQIDAKFIDFKNKILDYYNKMRKIKNLNDFSQKFFNHLSKIKIYYKGFLKRKN